MLAVTVYDVKYVEIVGLIVITVQAAVGREPDIMAAVFVDSPYAVLRQRFRRIGMAVPDWLPAIGKNDDAVCAS